MFTWSTILFALLLFVLQIKSARDTILHLNDTASGLEEKEQAVNRLNFVSIVSVTLFVVVMLFGWIVSGLNSMDLDVFSFFSATPQIFAINLPTGAGLMIGVWFIVRNFSKKVLKSDD